MSRTGAGEPGSIAADAITVPDHKVASTAACIKSIGMNCCSFPVVGRRRATTEQPTCAIKIISTMTRRNTRSAGS
jgi:hypothetical protein